MKKRYDNAQWYDPSPRPEGPDGYDGYEEEGYGGPEDDHDGDAAYYGEEDEYGDYDGDYDDDDYDEDHDDDGYDGEDEVSSRREAPPPRPRKTREAPVKRRKKRKKHWFRRLVVVLLLAGIVALLWGAPPERRAVGRVRQAGKCNILLAGTDQGGTRTDTIMLLSLDRAAGTARLLSIPRDTYAEGYAAYKINSAYGAAGGGAAGMEELMGQVEKTIGFSPDAYVLIDLNCLVEAVDILGGADFDVPVDMHYTDSAQGLTIDLEKGYQHLNGEQVMGLLRYRAGYATADIGRTEVQRAFLKEALSQWLRPAALSRLPELWRLYKENVVTDLSARNLLWIARVLLKADLGDMQTDVLPGWADMVGGSSVYMIDRTAAEAMLRDYDPYL